MNNLRLKASMIICLTVAAGLPARASTITVNFSPAAFTVLPGQTGVAALATLTNTDPANTVFLNGDNLSLPGAAAVDDEFFANVPFSLDPGQTSPLIELFRFDVAGGPVGTTIGTYQLFGGAGLANQFNLDLVASQNFTVTVRAVAVPEPGTSLLAGAALVAISLAARRRRTVRRA